MPHIVITDEGWEFASRLFNKMRESKGIVHHTIAPSKHQSNNRMERAPRKI